MALDLTPISELDAVNMMLLAIGESPVNDLDAPELADASLAHQRLHEVSRNVQNMGWHWNREADYPLAPDVDGYINIPTNALKVDPSDPSMRHVVRGTRLYDKVSRSYVFTSTVSVDVVWFLAWDELPQAARNYIVHRATREFAYPLVGDSATLQDAAENASKAWVALQHDEAEVADYNILTDSYDVARVINRWL